MNKCIRYCFTVVVAVLYLFSAIGFDIHTCSATGKVEIILPYGSSQCEHGHHDINCCSNESYSLEDNYTDSKTELTLSVLSLVTDILFPLPSSTQEIKLAATIELAIINSESPPIINNGYNKMLNIWRL